MADSRIIVYGVDIVSGGYVPLAVSTSGVIPVEVAGGTSDSPFFLPDLFNPTYLVPTGSMAAVMSNKDITDVLFPLGARLAKAGNYQEFYQTNGTAGAAGTVTLDPISSAGARSLRVITNLTALQAANTLTVRLQWAFVTPLVTDFVWTTLLSSTAIAAVGVNVLTVDPRIVAVANSIVQSPVPSIVRVQLVATGTYTCGVNLEWGA